MKSFREIRAERLADEQGTLYSEGGLGIALVYPSPYHVGMSSLGFQTIYRELNALPDVSAERAFLPDDDKKARAAREHLCTYESQRPVGDFPIVAFSLAYEMELAGLVTCLDLAGIPAFAHERTGRTFPLIVVGGPLTFSNPVPAGPYADVIVMGEGEENVARFIQLFRDSQNKEALLARLAKLPGFYIPSVHGETLLPVAAADNARLPAHSQIITPHTELSSMFLVEAARGCSRKCTYCVMRRSTNGGMRKVEPETLLATLPAHAKRVGLVGAAVTDHPRLPQMLRAIVDSGREVGISSLRADRLTDELVSLLAQGGYRTLTTAGDGASQAMRDRVLRGTSEENLRNAARLCKAHGMTALKLYMLLGLPDETMADVDDLIRFGLELAQIAPRLVITVAPFVAKRNTPLDRSPFEGVAAIDAKLARLRAGLAGKVKLVGESPKWAYFEYRLAQGGFAEGRAVAQVARSTGGFSAWRSAFATVAEAVPRTSTVTGI